MMRRQKIETRGRKCTKFFGVLVLVFFFGIQGYILYRSFKSILYFISPHRHRVFSKFDFIFCNSAQEVNVSLISFRIMCTLNPWLWIFRRWWKIQIHNILYAFYTSINNSRHFRYIFKIMRVYLLLNATLGTLL